jgi:hypothetical protein
MNEWFRVVPTSSHERVRGDEWFHPLRVDHSRRSLATEWFPVDHGSNSRDLGSPLSSPLFGSRGRAVDVDFLTASPGFTHSGRRWR